MAAKGSASPPEWARCDALSEVLADSWWALGLRGVLGILFGLICLLTPGIALGAFVILFSAYMLVDGVFAIISGIKAAERRALGPLDPRRHRRYRRRRGRFPLAAHHCCGADLARRDLGDCLRCADA